MRGKRGQRVLASVLFAAVLAMSALIIMDSDTGSAGIFPKVIQGYVLDSQGNPVPGANVTAKSYNGMTLVATLWYDATESDGFYTTTFSGDKWEVNYTIEVSAVRGAAGAQAIALADDSALQEVNLTLSLPGTMSLDLAVGWNMIALPFVDNPYNASTLGLRFGDLVVGWNSSSQVYDRTYIMGLSPESSDFPIEWVRGYWVYTSVATSLALDGNLSIGTELFVIDVPDGGGWALVGLTTLRTDLHASDIPEMANISGSISLVAGYNIVTGTYYSYIVGIPITDFPLVPGHGYWCHCQVDVTLAAIQ